MRAAGRQTKILVTDESAISRKLVETTLSDRQYSLTLAKSGRESLRLFAEHHPELLIADWTMPYLTGVEICRHIRSRPRGCYTYIILLTGRSEKQSVVEGLAAGADDYLTKPFHQQELMARVGVGLRIIDLQREIERQNIFLKEISLTKALAKLPKKRAVAK